MKTILKLLAPYLAAGVFWCVFENAWLTIIAYHAQVLAWAGGWPARPRGTSFARVAPWALPAICLGPLLYLLLPHMTEIDVSQWLVRYRLSGISLVAMIPYFGIAHPVLEQIHWAPLRERTVLAHFAFAGYHALVLYSLLPATWLILSCGVLAAASLAWRLMTARGRGLAAPIASHILADTGVILVAWLNR